jgi:phage gp46-like protein
VAQMQAELRTQEVSATAVQAGLLQELAQVYDSYSWWASKPLRAVGSLLLRLRPSLLRHSSNGRKPPQ